MGRELARLRALLSRVFVTGVAACAAGLAFCAAPSTASAYTPTVTSAGVPVRWKGSPKLDLAGNPVNHSGLGEASFRDAVVRSLQRWKSASGGAVRFDYWQGTDPNVYVPGSKYDGLTTIYFSSNSPVDNHLTQNVLGLTQVWYDTGSGEILEADIVLNDHDFRFTTDEHDTSGYGSSAASRFGGGRSNVFIENVITHELGHALGLSHSGGLQSTMLFMESPEQAHLGCDEASAIHALYPTADRDRRGAISGRVVGSDGSSPVLGAHVVAVSRRRGNVLATGLTNKDGVYTIGGLEPGAYFLMVEPFYAGPQSLPAYYSALRLDVCPGGRSFGRTALTDPTGALLLPVGVAGGETASAPAIAVNCATDGGAAIVDIRSSSALRASTRADGTDAPTLFDGARDAGGFGATDRFRSGDETRTYRLRNLGGNVELHVLSYSLYSPVKPTVELVDADGVVQARAQDEVYAGDSGFVDYDSAVTASGLPRGDYFLRVTVSPMDASLYPAGPISLDSVPFVVITGSVNEAVPALSGTLPVNARCRMDENFPQYLSPPGDPPRHYSNPDGNVGFCGTVASSVAAAAVKGSGPRGPGAGPGAAAITGWFLPWAFMAMIWRLALALNRARRFGPAGGEPAAATV